MKSFVPPLLYNSGMATKKNKAAVALGKLRAKAGDLAEVGRRGGLKRAEKMRMEGKDLMPGAVQAMGAKAGGAARAAKLTPEERSAIAKAAAAARWEKKA